MQLKLPTPTHGWRSFVGEVGIIVLGVLIALGGQQFVDNLRWKSEVAGFRESVHAEIAGNLWTYPNRARQKRCIARRLDELQRWLDSWRAKRPLNLIGPIGIPTSLVVRTSAWEGRDPALLSHMPRADKLEYGFLYSEFANNEVHRLDERAAWIELASYNGATELDHQDLMRLQGLIIRARLRDNRIDVNAGRFLKRAAAIGIRPVPLGEVFLDDPDLCNPILSPSTRGDRRL